MDYKSFNIIKKWNHEFIDLKLNHIFDLTLKLLSKGGK